MNRGNPSDRLWTIVLAGGEGERLRPLVQRWLGFHRPKQFCAFIGTRSRFQHTLDRADQITLPEQKVAVIGHTHQEETRAQLSTEKSGKLFVQLANRDTAADIFLAPTHVLAEDPQATVLVYPSDHFVHPENQLGKHLQGDAAPELLF